MLYQQLAQQDLLLTLQHLPVSAMTGHKISSMEFVKDVNKTVFGQEQNACA